MDESDLFSSPSNKPDAAQDEQPKTPTNQSAPFDAEEAREAALRRELEGVRNINEVIEGVIGTLERARGNMSVRHLCLWACHTTYGGLRGEGAGG